MKKSIEELYQRAKRFDEGELYQSEEYDAIAARQMELYRIMDAMFSPAIAPLMEEYMSLIYDEMEMECRHFFEQGYKIGQKEAESKA